MAAARSAAFCVQRAVGMRVEVWGFFLVLLLRAAWRDTRRHIESVRSVVQLQAR